MARQSGDEGWRRHVVEQMLPRMDANAAPATGFQQATAAGLGPITFYGDRTPNDPADLLEGLPSVLVKWTGIKQRAFDLHGSIPSFETLREVQLEKISHSNRISELVKPRGDGGPGLDASAPQVATVRKQMQRAEQELARLTELKETRTVRWNAAGQLERSITDWLLHGGIPSGVVLDPIDDPPLSELLKKGETPSDGVARYRLRQRELAADAHRIRSSPFPSSVAKTAAKALIDRLADQGQPNLDGAIEHGMDITFATITTTSMVHNVEARGAVVFTETADAIGTLCWLFRDQMLAKINAEFDQISDDKHALDERQRAEMLATIDLDDMSAQRAECSLVWAAAERGEIIDFRATTSPQAVLGVALRTVPRGETPGTSPEHAINFAQPGRRR